MDWHFQLKQWIKHLNDGFVYYKPTTFCLTRLFWWTGVVWITCGLLWFFISCLDILMAPIHCRRSSNVMLHFSKSVDPMKKFSNVSKNNNFGQCNLWSDSKLPQVHTISSIVKTGSEHPPDICLPPLAALQKGPWAPWPGHFWGQTGRCSQRSNWPALLVHLHCNTVRWRGRIW